MIHLRGYSIADLVKLAEDLINSVSKEELKQDKNFNRLYEITIALCTKIVYQRFNYIWADVCGSDGVEEVAQMAAIRFLLKVLPSLDRPVDIYVYVYYACKGGLDTWVRQTIVESDQLYPVHYSNLDTDIPQYSIERASFISDGDILLIDEDIYKASLIAMEFINSKLLKKPNSWYLVKIALSLIGDDEFAEAAIKTLPKMVRLKIKAMSVLIESIIYDHMTENSQHL